jgi:hypothetical protein
MLEYRYQVPFLEVLGWGVKRRCWVPIDSASGGCWAKPITSVAFRRIITHQPMIGTVPVILDNQLDLDDTGGFRPLPLHVCLTLTRTVGGFTLNGVVGHLGDGDVDHPSLM